MRIVDKKVPMDENIVDRIEYRLVEFLQQWGHGPEFIVLGPNEYMSLYGKILRYMDKPSSSDVQPLTYRGIVVLGKSTPGLDLIVTHRMIPFFTIGAIQERDHGKEARDQFQGEGPEGPKKPS